MSNKTKICVYTTTRAEYGLLKKLIFAIKNAEDFELCLFVSAMHLSPEYGYTYNDIKADGLEADEKIEMLLSADTETSIPKAIALGMITLADAFERHKPDYLVLLGDRFELMAAVQPALFMKIPIVHIYGGETSEGAFDESTRHAITKMSAVHCVATEEAKNRVIQMGENPANVFLTGSPGLDVLEDIKFLNREELSTSLGMKINEKSVLFCYHPVTLDDISQDDAIDEVIGALEKLDEDITLIMTKPNADPGAHSIINKLEAFAAHRKNCGLFASLGHQRYLSALNIVSMFVGNSSSGLHEVPSFGIPSINIGDRQKGRTMAPSVISVPVKTDNIYTAMQKAFATDYSHVQNPYFQENASLKILDAVRSIKNRKALLQKHFFDIK
jgi:UDP-N-acetylglucosamine 2-epimerase (non-hydrolysing)/GDP/UDP-N,N'-diacetylbacillosamine 2-epimerase (hydrolysing)